MQPSLTQNKQLSWCDFSKLFGNLSQSEQYDVITLTIENNIDIVDESELPQSVEKRKAKTTSNNSSLATLTNEMLCVMAKDGDQLALKTLIEKNQRFIHQIACTVKNQYKTDILTTDDLEQEGVFGVIEAVYHFELDLDLKFTTYSWHWIRQKMQRAVIDTGYLIRIPTHQFEKMIKVTNMQRRNPEFSVSDIAIQLDMSLNEIYNLMNLSQNYLNTTSLNLIVGDSMESELGELIPDLQSPSVEETVENTLLSEEISIIFSSLTPREEEVLRLRFGFNGREYTLEEIAAKYHLSRERIRQIEKTALIKLRRPSNLGRIKEYRK